jgi:hypothetical protein
MSRLIDRAPGRSWRSATSLAVRCCTSASCAADGGGDRLGGLV